MPFVPTARYLDHIFSGEASLCQIYPLPIQQLDRLHWSPLNVIYKAIQFLADKENVRILDIGSGVGKFCVAGAYYKPNALFYGVEQRQNLVEQAQDAKAKLGHLKVNFVHNNFTQLDLKQFDGFYFYNSFFENFPSADKIDDSIAYSADLYRYYSQYLRIQLDEMKQGTKLVTYCSWEDEIPASYQLVQERSDILLKFWIKNY